MSAIQFEKSSSHQKVYGNSKEEATSCPGLIQVDDNEFTKEKCKSAVKRLSMSSGLFLEANEVDEDDIILPSRGTISHHDSGKNT